MNLFTLSTSPLVSAQSLSDQHVTKMILETAQILDGGTRCFMTALKPGTSWADHQIVGIPATQRDNPVILSARSRWVWEWAYAHLSGLLSEFEYRHGKTHAYAKSGLQRALQARYDEVSSLMTDGLLYLAIDRAFIRTDQTHFGLLDCVRGHRSNYVTHKLTFGTKVVQPARWTRRFPPSWLGSYLLLRQSCTCVHSDAGPHPVYWFTERMAHVA